MKKEYKKIHLGCGKINIPGFVNVDLAKFSHINYRHGIDKLPMFKNNSAELIYTCGAFEYFDRTEAPVVLKEWRRVLKKGGVLRISVPNFESIIKVYLKYKNLDGRGILGPLFGRWPIPGINKIIYQKTVYDYKSLKNLLENNGFTNIKKYDWRKTVHKDYDDYSQAYIPHMDQKGIHISLNIEATKK